MGSGVRTRLFDRLPPWAGAFSVGCWLIAAAGLVAGIAAFARGERRDPGLEMWVFADIHKKLYDPIVLDWNQSVRQESAGALAVGEETAAGARTPDEAGVERKPVNLTMLGQPALLRRMLAGFFGGLPTADLIEVERTMAGQLFAGPVEAVGFVDLTDRLKEEGLYDAVPAASRSPWTTRGRTFGLPHDVHPVLLGVRMDLALEAGISRDQVRGIETWEDLRRVLGPLMADADGDGQADRYLLSFWPTESHRDKIEMLLLQSGTGFFDEDGMPVIASDANARTLARMVSWCVGPGRIAADVRDFDATGNQLKTDGYAVTYFMPDWMCAVWKNELPNMSGTLELIPLPAAEPGGRRTSVWGGTMLGIPKTAEDFEAAWAFAKRLYFSPDLARELYISSDIVTPIEALWDDPVYDGADDYFRGQAKGRLYIEQIPDVPARNASPYSQIAILRVADAATKLHRWAQENGVTEASALEAEAMRVLERAEEAVRRPMERNLFLDQDEEPAGGGGR
jgi:arabinosaccharide transport system substrate-binding protein